MIGLVAASVAFGADTLNGGKGKIYLGGRPDRIFVIDETTEKVVDEIHTKTGTPSDLQISEDRKRFYLVNVSFEDVEIVDVPSRKVIDTFRLSAGNKKVRVFGYAADPLNRFMILLTKSSERTADRFELGPPTLLQYDLKEHKVVRTIPWPKGEEREFAYIRFSPDGKFLYLFGEDVVVFDTTEFKQVDKWELSRPLEPGFGRIDFGAMDDLNDEPGFYTGIFNVKDEVNHRDLMGVARVNLIQKNVDFYTLGPTTRLGFTLAPGRKWGYGLHSEIGKYEFWSFDLANRRMGKRVEFPGRPRMSLKTSSNGQLLYIYSAGNTIDLYDTATFKYLRTITLDADMTTNLYVMGGQ
jgi:hypothetical protein